MAHAISLSVRTDGVATSEGREISVKARGDQRVGCHAIAVVNSNLPLPSCRAKNINFRPYRLQMRCALRGVAHAGCSTLEGIGAGTALSPHLVRANSSDNGTGSQYGLWLSGSIRETGRTASTPGRPWSRGRHNTRVGAARFSRRCAGSRIPMNGSGTWRHSRNGRCYTAKPQSHRRRSASSPATLVAPTTNTRRAWMPPGPAGWAVRSPRRSGVGEAAMAAFRMELSACERR